MPANSSRFNTYLSLAGLWISLIPSAFGAIPQLPEEHYSWLADRIFANECNREHACLTHWNSGEDFPSLGIGHFIWYRADQQAIFEETFPQLLQHLQQAGVFLPTWLNPPLAANNPWQNQQQFQHAENGPKLAELRGILAANMGLQAQFIALRLEQTLDDIVASFPLDRQEEMADLVRQLASLPINGAEPLGLYALIDYLHFKGSGLQTSERYHGQGWGLRQVLGEMHPDNASLPEFVRAATLVLETRVANAPVERNEQRWLAGWTNRLHTYLP